MSNKFPHRHVTKAEAEQVRNHLHVTQGYLREHQVVRAFEEVLKATKIMDNAAYGDK